MTTSVKVNAHAGWPVKVLRNHMDNERNLLRSEETIVAPNTEQEFFVHSHLELHVIELLEVKATEAASA